MSTTSEDTNRDENGSDVTKTGDWIDDLEQEQIEQLVNAYRSGRFNPVDTILTERNTLASELSTIGSSLSARAEQNWFRKMIRGSVYTRFKFTCMKDRVFDSSFCKAVFSATGVISTSILESIIGWHKGMSSEVFFAPMMPAIRAVAITSPFFNEFSNIKWSVLSSM